MMRRWVIAFAVMTGVWGVPGVAHAAAKGKGNGASRGCAGAGAVVGDQAARRKATSTVLCLVNRARASHGARALRPSAGLANAATSHSAEMIGGRFFSHVSPDGTGVRSRIMRAGYIRHSRTALVDETIAWGSGTLATPANLVESFMRSTLHRRTLLDGRYRDFGAGLLLGAPMPGIGGAAATLTLNFGRR